MSHEIKGVDSHPLENFDILPCKQLVTPRFKNKFKGIKPSAQQQSKKWVQESVIKSICKKLNDRQFALMQKENAAYIDRKLSSFKSKLKREINSKTVSNFFDENLRRESLDLKTIFKKMPEKIDLGRKYNNKMVMTVQLAKQAHQISKQKSSYLQWMNRQKNSPLNSPNYQKMNFVFEKLEERPGDIKISRHKVTKNLFVKQKNNDYKPLERRVKTLGHQPLIRLTR